MKPTEEQEVKRQETHSQHYYDADRNRPIESLLDRIDREREAAHATLGNEAAQ